MDRLVKVGIDWIMRCNRATWSFQSPQANRWTIWHTSCQQRVGPMIWWLGGRPECSVDVFLLISLDHIMSLSRATWSFQCIFRVVIFLKCYEYLNNIIAFHIILLRYPQHLFLNFHLVTLVKKSYEKFDIFKDFHTLLFEFLHHENPE